MRAEEAAAVASLVSFSIFGFNREGRFEVPGTGFRIAPGLGLSARHVTSYIFERLGLHENEPWPRHQKLFKGMEVRAAEQEFGREGDDQTSAWWWVEGSFPSKLTDIAVLVLTPGNDAAVRAEKRRSYFRWSLDPPRMDQRLWAFGYAEQARVVTTDESKMNFEIAYTVSVEPLRVEAVFEHGRREDVLDRPAFLTDPSNIDTGSMACFEVRGTLSPSMSGGPVFNGDLLYGVVSSGLTYADDEDGSPPLGRVALLRTLTQMGSFALDASSPTMKIADMLANGSIPFVEAP